MRDLSWEAELRTPEQLTLNFELVTPQLIYDAISAGDLPAFSIDNESYVTIRNFFIWVFTRINNGELFEVELPDGRRVYMTDPRGIPGCSLTGPLKAEWQRKLSHLRL